MPDSSGLLIEWARGWSVARGRPTPVAVDGGVRIDVGQSPVTSRYVLPAFDPPSVSRLGAALVGPGTEIKTLAASADLRACLSDRWSMYHRNDLMVSTFGRSPAVLPGRYSSRVVDVRAAVVVAEVRDGDGVVVSSGRLARWGPYGIVDAVRTSGRHRRRGLATVVMAGLADWAVGHGVRTGVLAATEEGASLYRTLGWREQGEIAGAFRHS